MSAPVASETLSPFSASREIRACSAGGLSPGGDQERAELVAVQGGGVRFVVQTGTTDVGGGRVLQELFFDGVLIEPGDGAQPPGNRGAGPALGFQFAGEGLDVGAADQEQRQ
jgi:hypothetical protein